jgi:hypothetical protein
MARRLFMDCHGTGAFGARSTGGPMKTLAPFVLALLAGCASYSGSGLEPGSATRDDVLRTMGRPDLELPDGGGGAELVYPHGPLGTETFIAHVDGRGVLTRVEQVLDDDHFRRIHEGQTRDEVLRAIGPPGDRMRFGNGNVAWVWRFIDTWGYLSEFNVSFNPAGIVVSKIAIRIEHDRGSDH